jgi:hypothetical protein
MLPEFLKAYFLFSVSGESSFVRLLGETEFFDWPK